MCGATSCGRCSTTSNGERDTPTASGLCYVDYATQRRIPKASARWYAQMIRAKEWPRRAMKRILLADIGGTYARFAVLSGDRLASVLTLSVNDHPQIADAIRHFLAKQGGTSSIETAILALAGPVGSDRCALTNSAWVVDGEALKHEFGFRTVRLVNDHEAAAWSLPRSAPSDTLRIGPDEGAPDAPMALLGPGTGLGMACYLRGPGGKALLRARGAI